MRKKGSNDEKKEAADTFFVVIMTSLQEIQNGWWCSFYVITRWGKILPMVTSSFSRWWRHPSADGDVILLPMVTSSLYTISSPSLNSVSYLFFFFRIIFAPLFYLLLFLSFQSFSLFSFIFSLLLPISLLRSYSLSPHSYQYVHWYCYHYY